MTDTGHTIDPQYVFNFVSHGGRPYSREVYWEKLYSVSVSEETILAADRIVPHSTAPWALYLTMKGRHKTSKQKLLADASYENLPLIKKVTDIVVASAEDDFGSLLVPDSQQYPVQVSSLPSEAVRPIAGGTDATSTGDEISSIYKAAEIAGITNTEIERQIDDSCQTDRALRTRRQAQLCSTNVLLPFQPTAENSSHAPYA